MQSSIENLSDIEVKVTVEVPPDLVKHAFEKELAKIAKKVQVKGFRKGKAPKSLIKSQYQAFLAGEVAQHLYSDTIEEATKSVEDRLVGLQEGPSSIPVEGEAYSYSVVFQARPQITLHSWKGMEVPVTPLIVSDEDIQRELEAKQALEEELVEVEDRGADTGDTAYINAEAFVDGERNTFLDMVDANITLGTEAPMPGFSDALLGMKPGETREFTLTAPEDFVVEAIQKKDVTYKVTLDGLKTVYLPPINDDLAIDFDFESLEDWKNKLREELLEEKTELRKREGHDKALELILERNPFEVPVAMIQNAAQRAAENFLAQFRSLQLPPETMRMLIDRQSDEFIRQGERNARYSVIYDTIEREEGISVSDEELSEEIAKRIDEMGADAARAFEDKETREQLANILLSDKIRTLILEQITLVDKVVEEESETDTALEDASSEEE